MRLLPEIRAVVEDEWHVLQRHHVASQQVWQDALQQKFETFWQEYEQAVPRFLNQANSLADTIRRIRTEVR
jgi:uncharacterized protein YukE